MNKHILPIYILFAYAFLNMMVGFHIIDMFATTTMIADMQSYDVVVCGVGAIFIAWGLLIVGAIVTKK